MTTVKPTGSICTAGSERPLRSRRLGRALLLAAVTLVLLTVSAAIIFGVAVVTLFRARRLCGEVMARWLSRLILAMWGIRLDVRQHERFPDTQAIYISNHTSTLDMFVLVALGLPNTRYVGAQDLDGFLRFMAPLGPISFVMGTLWTPPQSQPAERTRWFQRTERMLRRTGGSIYLSPEGERVTTGRLGRFNKGVFHLATNLGAPIVPIYIDIPPEINPGKGFDAGSGTIGVRVLPIIGTRDWTLDGLESNTRMVRDAFVKVETERRAGTMPCS